jgi:hypothetical protein
MKRSRSSRLGGHAQVLRRHRFSCNKNNRACGQRRDWDGIIQHVVGERIERAVQHERGVDAETNRVAIRPRAGGSTDADASSAPPMCSMMIGCTIDPRILRHNAPDRVRCAARRKRHGHGDPPRRIALSHRDAREEM